jgi:hypothetical protein
MPMLNAEERPSVFVDAPIVLQPADIAATFGNPSQSEEDENPSTLAGLGERGSPSIIPLLVHISTVYRCC